MAGDLFFPQVQLLLHCNGTDGSTTFTDSSPTPKTVTAYGNAHVEVDQYKFGTASAAFDGNGDYLTVTNHAGLNLSSGNWTVEMWVRPTAANPGNQIIAEHDSSSYYKTWQIQLYNNKLACSVYLSSAVYRGFTAATALPLNEWAHIAFVRNGDQIMAFANGVLQGSTSLGASTLAGPVYTPAIGATRSGSFPFTGYIDDIRITAGVARYTAGFTPPTEQFPDVALVGAFAADAGLPAANAAAFSVSLVTATGLDTGPIRDPSSARATVQPVAFAADGGSARAPAMLGWHLFAMAHVDAPMAPQSAYAAHDFRPLVNTYPIRYTMELSTPGGTVVVPISSWQATLQTDSQCYAGCVIPNCAAWLDEIQAASEFTVYRHCTTRANEPLKHQMVRAPVQAYQIDQGTTNYTCSLQGYFDAYASEPDPAPRYDATLAGLRSVSTYGSGLRVRSAIDWLLQPAQRAYYGDAGASLVVSFINYYANGSDEYCDVGSREAGAP